MTLLACSLGRSASALILAATLATACPAHADERLAQVRARGAVTCGLPANVPGFAVVASPEHAEGFDADWCRAVAAAVFGDAARVRFLPVDTLREFLDRPDIDLVFHGLTWKFTREVGADIAFGPVTFHDGQAVMVRRDHPAAGLDALAQASVCVEAGTGFAAALRRRAQENGLALTMFEIEGASAAQDNFFAGRCDALSADASALFAAAAAQPAGLYRILPERLSKEPLAPVVRKQDADLAGVLRWTVYAVIAAEELGVTTAVATNAGADPSPAAARFLAAPGHRGWGLANGWTAAVIRQVGHYGEMYARHFTAKRGAEMPRGFNASWTAGGLLFAPPIP